MWMSELFYSSTVCCLQLRLSESLQLYKNKGILIIIYSFKVNFQKFPYYCKLALKKVVNKLYKLKLKTYSLRPEI